MNLHPYSKEYIEAVAKLAYAPIDKTRYADIANVVMRDEYASVSSLSPFFIHDSSSRGYMFWSHFGQRLVTDNTTELPIVGGLAAQMAKYSLNVQMPRNGRIVRLIPKYQTGVDAMSFSYNPMTLVIYEDDATKRLDCFEVPNYMSFHQYFGYKLKPGPAFDKLAPEKYVSAGEVFKETPSVSSIGSYNYGVLPNVAFMSLPGVAENSMIISESYAKQSSYTVSHSRTFQFGSTGFPVNRGTNENELKAFIDIGDVIPEDGILACVRAFNDTHGVTQMSIRALNKIDHTFDDPVYVAGPGGRVVDVTVIRNPASPQVLPETLRAHLDKYAVAYRQFHQAIIDTEHNYRTKVYRQRYGDTKYEVGPQLSRLLVESMAICNYNPENHKQPLALIHKKNPVDEYYVKVVVEYKNKIGIKNKFAGFHGDKGIVGEVWPDERMPVDARGVRADIIRHGASVFARMNEGVFYEHYVSTAAQEIRDRMRIALDWRPGMKINDFKRIPFPRVKEQFDILLQFYECFSDYQYQSYLKHANEPEFVYKELYWSLKNLIKMYIVPQDQVMSPKIVANIRARFHPTYSYVSYIDDSGKVCIPKKRTRIGPQAGMWLEKIADTWSAVTSPRMHLYGVPSPIIQGQRYSQSHRHASIKIFGETEFAIVAGYAGTRLAAEFYDRSNNPTTAKAITNVMLNADNTANIDSVIDRKIHPYGLAKPLQQITHRLMCYGSRFAHIPETRK